MPNANLEISVNALSSNQLQNLINQEDHNPHHFLGLHNDGKKGKEIRLWRPYATKIYLEVFGKIVEAEHVDGVGLFQCQVPAETTALDYRVYHHSGLLAHDPYSFWPTFGDIDQYLFGSGVHYDLYKVLGGRLTTHEGVQGVKFAVWAPAAVSVSLVANFNHWDGRVNPMRSLGASGVWELFVPGLQEGEKYKFEIRTQAGELRIKSDPYGYSSELRPHTASVVANIERFQWSDQSWMEARSANANKPKPLNVYEVHLGSWRKREGHFMNYRELGQQLVAYCLEMAFSHIELMPIQEHPLDESWGYQVSGFYAATSRFGTPEDFQWLVNHCHENNIGVILDWVPGHFPTDDFSLARFDGTALYEHADPKQGFHPHWNTLIFNFGRREVSNFLISNALYWFKEMHIDGLRVDAVASMLYLDYGREEGQWIPNPYGGKENIEAIEFFKHLNSAVHQQCPGVLTIAEESTSFFGVTHGLDHGGLGFDLKWNMGWMNDTLQYFTKEMIFRNYHQQHLTFGLLYAFSEKFMLVLSHDEVVHGKRSLLNKMPGDMWQKFANLRLLYSYMICQPGKKLLFMGGEIGQWNEWNAKGEIEWNLLHYQTHRGIQELVKDINHLYRYHDAFWERDFDQTGFEWVDFSDRHHCTFNYLRKGSHGVFLCVHNFTEMYHAEYSINLGNLREAKELFNSDHEKYGGSGKVNASCPILYDQSNKPYALKIQLAPLATMIFQVHFC